MRKGLPSPKVAQAAVSAACRLLPEETRFAIHYRPLVLPGLVRLYIGEGSLVEQERHLVLVKDTLGLYGTPARCDYDGLGLPYLEVACR